MAAFTSTVTEKRETANTFASNILNVYSRTFTFTIPAGTTSGSTLDAITLPNGTYILDILDKYSVTLANSATIAYSVGAGSAIATAATKLASTSMAQIGTITKANCIVTGADSTLRITTGAGTIDNASVGTVTLVCANIDTQAGTYTTYTV